MNTKINRVFAGFVLAAACSGRLFADPTPARPAATPAPAVAPAQPVKPDDHYSGNGDRVIIHHDLDIAEGETVPHDAVVIMGDLTCDGDVKHDVVVILGNVTLGAQAHVGHDVVCIGGHITKDPAATIGHEPVEVDTGHYFPMSPTLSAWWHRGLSHGRLLPFGKQVCWIWVLNVSLIAFYTLLSAVFPVGIRKCGDALVARPLAVLSMGSLVILGLPILFLLLLLSIVGIPVAIVVLPVGIAVGLLFGRAAIYNLVGRSIGSQGMHPALATLLGGLIFLCLYAIPAVGIMLSILVAFVGFACVAALLFASLTSPGRPPSAPPVPPLAASPEPATPPVVAPPAAPPTVAPAAAILESSLLGLPKAGFWIRMLALMLDFVLLGVVMHGIPFLVFPGIALYGAIMWKLKGTTVAGMIFHLRVVRLDGRPIDWGTALTRAFACFFSAIVVGLGFVWIGFDSEKQGWHDKIAGTVVVRTPQSTPLV